MDGENNKRKTIIIIIAVFVLLIAAFLVWWLFFRPAPPVNNANTEVNTNTITVNFNLNATNIAVNQNVNAQSEEQVDIIRLANIFAERFGSYSSQAEFQNITDLKKYMTPSMQSWADKYVKQQSAAVNTNAYSANITKVVTTKILSQKEKSSTVEVTTQRTEEGSNINGKSTYYQKIVLIMAKDSAGWLVDKATWQPK